MEISNRSIYRVLTAITVYIGLLALAFVLRTQLIWIFTAAFLALAVNPVVERLARYAPKQRRGLATGVVFAAFVVALSVSLFLLVPALIKQTQILLKDLPSYVEQVENSDSLLGQIVDRYNLAERFKSDQSQIIERISHSSDSILNFLKSIFSGAVAGLTVLTLTFFMLVEGPTWVRRLWRYMPAKRSKHYQPLAKQMYEVVTGYVTGNLLISLIAAVATTIILAILKVPFAIPLGILVGVLDLLPLVGATLGAIIVVVICLFSSLTTATIMAVFFTIYQQIENNVLQPLVYGRMVQLSPLMVLIAGILGVTLGGILGALVAIPIAACLQILVRDYLKNHF